MGINRIEEVTTLLFDLTTSELQLGRSRELLSVDCTEATKGCSSGLLSPGAASNATVWELVFTTASADTTWRWGRGHRARAECCRRADPISCCRRCTGLT
jgi:hypothetical protein